MAKKSSIILCFSAWRWKPDYHTENTRAHLCVHLQFTFLEFLVWPSTDKISSKTTLSFMFVVSDIAWHRTFTHYSIDILPSGREWRSTSRWSINSNSSLVCLEYQSTQRWSRKYSCPERQIRRSSIAASTRFWATGLRQSAEPLARPACSIWTIAGEGFTEVQLCQFIDESAWRAADRTSFVAW